MDKLVDNTEKSKLKGFTILEIVVSLAIGALLLGAGLAGFVYFQRSTIFNQGRNEYQLVLRDTQNKARNSVSYNASVPLTTQVEGYAIFINLNNAQLRYCLPGLGGNLTCNGIIGNTLTPKFSQTLIMTADAPCVRIYFERVTGRMYSLTLSGSQYIKSSPSNCNVTLRHSQDSTLTRTVQFDFSNGTFTEI